MLNLLGFESDEPTNLLVTDAYDFGDASNGIDLDLRYNEGIRGAVSQGDLSIAAGSVNRHSMAS